MAIEPAVREALKVRSDLGELEGRVSRLEELERGRSSTLARLAEISDILPQSAYLMSVRLDTAQLRLDGWSASATALVPVLERQAWAKAVRLAGPVQREHRALGWRERFSVTVDLGPVASDEQTARALP